MFLFLNENMTLLTISFSKSFTTMSCFDNSMSCSLDNNSNDSIRSCISKIIDSMRSIILMCCGRRSCFRNKPIEPFNTVKGVLNSWLADREKFLSLLTKSVIRIEKFSNESTKAATSVSPEIGISSKFRLSNSRLLTLTDSIFLMTCKIGLKALLDCM